MQSSAPREATLHKNCWEGGECYFPKWHLCSQLTHDCIGIMFGKYTQHKTRRFLIVLEPRGGGGTCQNIYFFYLLFPAFVQKKSGEFTWDYLPFYPAKTAMPNVRLRWSAIGPKSPVSLKKGGLELGLPSLSPTP